jgi:hypothetical protein
MGHVIEHIALEIQTLAGMETGFGRTRETKHPESTMSFLATPRKMSGCLLPKVR